MEERDSRYVEKKVPPSGARSISLVHMRMHNRTDSDANAKAQVEEEAEDNHSLTSTETTQVGQMSEVCTQARLFSMRPTLLFDVESVGAVHGIAPVAEDGCDA